MRRSASEVIRSLEMRIARLEKQSAPKGKGQIAIMERLQVMGIGEHYFNDVVSGLRVNYGSLQSAAKALHNKGLVKVDNPNVPLMIQLTEKGEQMRIARLEKSASPIANQKKSNFKVSSKTISKIALAIYELGASKEEAQDMVTELYVEYIWSELYGDVNYFCEIHGGDYYAVVSEASGNQVPLVYDSRSKALRAFKSRMSI